MNFERIVLCTDAPQGQGLAYYYYRALVDTLGTKKISILNEGARKYGAGILNRGVRRVKFELGLLSKLKYHRLMAEITPGKKNVVILFNSADLREEEIRKLASDPNIFLVNYLSDHPYAMMQPRQQELFACLPYFNLVLVFATALMPVLYQLGARRVERIPFGYCKYTHFEPARNVEVAYPNKIFYFGTWTPLIEQWLGHFTNVDLEIEGNGWYRAKDLRLRGIGTKKTPNTDHNMAIMARKAGLVVNFTRAPHGCFHTMKTFELPAAGACVLSNYSDEQNVFFQNQRSMVYFETSKEMIRNAEELISNREKNTFIRNNAIVDSVGHSYHNRSEILLNFLNE